MYLRFNFKSYALGKYVDVSVTYPAENYLYSADAKINNIGKRKYRVYEPGMKFRTVYLIHGGSEDDTGPYRFSNVERYATEANVMTVTPDISNGFGIDTCYNVRYQTFLAEELPVIIQTRCASSPKREDNYSLGLAMGGNAALGTAIMHPDKYCKCFDISGGIGMTLNNETIKKELVSDHFNNEFPLFVSSFGKPEDFENSRFDIYHKLKRDLESGVELPEFKIACGSKEFIRERVEDDYRIMKELGAPVSYDLCEGYNHDFDFWDMYIRRVLTEML